MLTKIVSYLKNRALVKLLFLSFAFFLPVSQKISTINIVVLVAASVFFFNKKQVDYKLGLLWPVLLYFIYCISLIYSSEFQWGIIEQKASLLMFPVIFLLNKDCINYLNLILKYFVLGCLTALIICEFNAFYNSVDFVNLVFDSRLNKSISFYNSIQKEENFLFSYNFSFIHQTVYFSTYLLLAISVLLYRNFIKNLVLRNGIILFFIIGLLQISNKASFIILFILLLIRAYQTLINKKQAVLYTLLLTFVAVVLFVLNPRFNNFYNNNFAVKDSSIIEKDFKKINNKNPNNTNFRVMLWYSAVDLIKENPLLGIGAGGSHNRLYEVFAVKRQWYDRNEKHHAHNQYLQVLLDTGIIGFVPFLLCFVVLIRFTVNFKDKDVRYLVLSFTLIIIINFLFESMFERYSGISFFTFFYCLLIFLNERTLELNNSEILKT